jgi:hypothetical protein
MMGLSTEPLHAKALEELAIRLAAMLDRHVLE